MHQSNTFITLTYDECHLPPGNTLRKSDWQEFAKALRYEKGPFRFFHCGEYGDEKGRAHYHALLFGLDFSDSVPVGRSKAGELYFDSPILNGLWGRGRTSTGPVTFSSAAYTARYVTKKLTGADAEKHYDGRLPEYCTQSKMPPPGATDKMNGLGAPFLRAFKSDVFPRDYVKLPNGRTAQVPRYYDKWLENHDPKMYKSIKRKRKMGHETPDGDRRLKDREIAKMIQTETLKREI